MHNSLLMQDETQSCSDYETQSAGVKMFSPDSEDYKLVFISSNDSSSKEDEYEDSSSTTSSVHTRHSISLDDCDWDYFESGVSNKWKELSTGVSPFGSPLLQRRHSGSGNWFSPKASPLLYRRHLKSLRESDTGTDEEAAAKSSASPVLQHHRRVSSNGSTKQPCPSGKHECDCGSTPHYVPIAVPVPIPVPMSAFQNWTPPDLLLKNAEEEIAAVVTTDAQQLLAIQQKQADILQLWTSNPPGLLLSSRRGKKTLNTATTTTNNTISTAGAPVQEKVVANTKRPGDNNKGGRDGVSAVHGGESVGLCPAEEQKNLVGVELRLEQEIITNTINNSAGGKARAEVETNLLFRNSKQPGTDCRGGAEEEEVAATAEQTLSLDFITGHEVAAVASSRELTGFNSSPPVKDSRRISSPHTMPVVCSSELASDDNNTNDQCSGSDQAVLLLLLNDDAAVLSNRTSGETCSDKGSVNTHVQVQIRDIEAVTTTTTGDNPPPPTATRQFDNVACRESIVAPQESARGLEALQVTSTRPGKEERGATVVDYNGSELEIAATYYNHPHPLPSATESPLPDQRPLVPANMISVGKISFDSDALGYLQSENVFSSDSSDCNSDTDADNDQDTSPNNSSSKVSVKRCYNVLSASIARPPGEDVDPSDDSGGEEESSSGQSNKRSGKSSTNSNNNNEKSENVTGNSDSEDDIRSRASSVREAPSSSSNNNSSSDSVDTDDTGTIADRRPKTKRFAKVFVVNKGDDSDSSQDSSAADDTDSSSDNDTDTELDCGEIVLNYVRPINMEQAGVEEGEAERRNRREQEEDDSTSEDDGHCEEEDGDVATTAFDEDDPDNTVVLNYVKTISDENATDVFEYNFNTNGVVLNSIRSLLTDEPSSVQEDVVVVHENRVDGGCCGDVEEEEEEEGNKAGQPMAGDNEELTIMNNVQVEPVDLQQQQHRVIEEEPARDAIDPSTALQLNGCADDEDGGSIIIDRELLCQMVDGVIRAAVEVIHDNNGTSNDNNGHHQLLLPSSVIISGDDRSDSDGAGSDKKPESLELESAQNSINSERGENNSLAMDIDGHGDDKSLEDGESECTRTGFLLCSTTNAIIMEEGGDAVVVYDDDGSKSGQEEQLQEVPDESKNEYFVNVNYLDFQSQELLSEKKTYYLTFFFFFFFIQN